MAKSSLGVDENVAGLLCYVAGWITGLVFLLLEKESQFVKFHALQSLITFGAVTVLSVFLGVVPVVGWFIIPFVWLAALVLWVICMIKAYQGEKFKVPVAGDIAEKQLAKG